ncbi:hypothetical protein AYL99_05560 [Fonsecaea erecta]|uniref:Uncharacterized protein n=1 Tax=Fonsecaea erecta TaxID=1367422 RepID=A0A178ZL82_9EURO|nr:hypothetical protein AYL99_05560 [Fonsecaea erecta]OAP60558.1 hypothetical protein AYL99_05560 [Fonsecaea erecta]
MAYPQETFTRTILSEGSLIARRRNAVASKTLFYQLKILKETGRYDAFRLRPHPSYDDPPVVWPIPNHILWESDVAKWIEGACYLLRDWKDPAVDSAVQELVDMIRGSILEDGGLNVHNTMVALGQRFTNLRDLHELYNAGHLIEAALAHNDFYQHNDLLDPILKYVELLCRTFGRDTERGQIPGYPGHPEIELALLRLYHRTRDPKHLKLAKFFITERGNPVGIYGRHYFRFEAHQRGENPHAILPSSGEPDALWYYQAHKPLVEQQTIEGHAVRAIYLLAAAADLVRLDPTSNAGLKDAVYRLWDNMVECKMYVTGGIGAVKQWKGFGPNYFLPQGTDEGGCHAETCAAIGVMMLAERILQYDLDRRFSDIMELSLYNAVLTSMSHDGTKFTDVNQLASSDQDPSKRDAWTASACCPANLLRLLGQIGGYVYTQTEEYPHQVNVHLYVPSAYEFTSGNKPATLYQTTTWPWEGKVVFGLSTISPLVTVSLALRIPGWATNWQLDPSPPSNDLQNGYLILSAEWLSDNRSFSLSIDISPRLVTPHPLTNQDTIAVVRGPVVYCVEDVDNPWVEDHFKTTLLDKESYFAEKLVDDETTGEYYVALSTKGARMLKTEGIRAYPSVPFDEAAKLDSSNIRELNFVPYFFKANRGGRGQARVGLRRWHDDL